MNVYEALTVANFAILVVLIGLGVLGFIKDYW